MAGAFDIFVAYKFIRILTTPYKKTDAYKLGIIDDKGNLLKKRKELNTGAEKKAYTIIHTLVWNLKRLLDKIPATKTRLGSFAVALWLLKEKLKDGIKESVLEECFLSSVGIEDLKESKEYQKTLEAGLFISKDSLPIMYDFINTRDNIVLEESKPVGFMLNQPIYAGSHALTGRKVYFSYEDVFRISK
tara:strand:+ start:14379 stop:14945 length:567 start_codon:yes stop_codon:yes gene_type:complete